MLLFQIGERRIDLFAELLYEAHFARKRRRNCQVFSAIGRIALWSNYAGAGDVVHFVRVGTLDEPDRLPPDIHIFTESKQPWFELPAGAPAVPGYYDRNNYWPQESLERRAALLARTRK